MNAHRKISAHFIYTVSSGTVANGIVHIAEDGTVLSVEKSIAGHEDFNTEYYNGVIVPGFVNAHCHLELSYLKNVFRGNYGMAGFLEQMTKKRNENSEKASDCVSMYDNKMYKEGVSVCADIINTSATSEIKKSSKIHYVNFIEVFGLRSGDSEAILSRAGELKQLYSNSYITPHALYSLSDKLYEGLKDILKNEKISSLHYMESSEEVQYFKDSSGKLAEKLREMGPEQPSITKSGFYEMMRNLFPKGHKLLLIHNTFAGRNDVEKMNNLFPENFRVLCPVSNKFISGNLPDLFAFDPNRICIGTDSLASNHDLNMLSEMKLLQNEFPNLTFDQTLQWATYNGAVALEVENVYGKIEPGMRPGLVLLEKFDFRTMNLKSDTVARRLV